MFEIITKSFTGIMSNIAVQAIATVIAGMVLNKLQGPNFEKLKANVLQDQLTNLVTAGKMSLLDLYRARNALAIAKQADEILAREQHNRDETIRCSFDWFFRFYESASKISEKSMQEIWAKILAGELNRPGTYSIKLLEILNCMGQRQARLFNKIHLHSIWLKDSLVLPNYDFYLKCLKINNRDITTLDEYGLLSENPLRVIRFTINDDWQDIASTQDKTLRIRSSTDKPTKVRFKIFSLTQAGRELASIQHSSITAENLFALAHSLIQEHKSIEVAVNQIESETTTVNSPSVTCTQTIYSPENLINTPIDPFGMQKD